MRVTSPASSQSDFKSCSDNLYSALFEVVSILVPSHRLRIMVLLSSGCKATFEGLANVQLYSTTHSFKGVPVEIFKCIIKDCFVWAP